MVLKSLLLNMSEEMTDLLGAFFLLSLLVGAVVVANRTTLLNSIKQSATNSRAESRKAAVRKSCVVPGADGAREPAGGGARVRRDVLGGRSALCC